MREAIDLGALELRFLADGNTTNGALTLFEMVVAPSGAMPTAHYHESWEETVYGLAGTITWTVDGRAIPVGPGETVHIPRGAVHRFDNLDGEAARALVMITPANLGPAYFRELAAELNAAGAPDPARMKAIMARHGLVPAPG